jgi:hypothetical protein
MLEQKLIDFITVTVKAQATKARDDAGYSGAWNDGGAAAMERHLNFWLLGLIQKVPAQYDKIVVEYEKQHLKENSGEYRLFLNLREKYKKFDV